MAKSKQTKKKENYKDVRSKMMVPLAVMGFLFIFGTAILDALVPSLPASLRNILYLIGVVAFVVYMIQIAFEKRTGKSETGGESKQNRLSGRK